MKVNTEHLRRMEFELNKGIHSLKRILQETERIEKQLRYYDSLMETASVLRNWQSDAEISLRKTLNLSMALDSIARSYESNENRIQESADEEQMIFQGYTRRYPVWSSRTIEQALSIRKVLDRFGGDQR